MTALPIQHPAASRHALRLKLIQIIDRLIVALDQIDGDPDLEDSDEDDQCDDEGAFDGDADNSDYEPSLCGIGMTVAGAAGVYRAGDIHYDLEADGDEQ